MKDFVKTISVFILINILFPCCKVIETEKEYVTNEIEKKYVSAVTFSTKSLENGIQISMESETIDALIFYTLDGSTPTTKSFLYTTPIALDIDFTIMAIGVKNGLENSPISFAKVSINDKKIIDTNMDETPPANITNLLAENKDTAILLTWTDCIDTDIFGYEVSYFQNSEARTLFESLSERMLIIGQGVGGCYITNLENDVEYKFIVKSIDTSGNKSSGIQIMATPKIISSNETMKIELNAETGLSNTTATIQVHVITKAKVMNVVYKKNGSINAATLLADSTANSAIKQNDDEIWTFEVDERATYTVAAIDEIGREETAQIYTRVIDKTPPSDIQNVTSTYSVIHNSIEINWNDPIDTDDEFESPFEYVLIKYRLGDSEDTITLSEMIQKGDCSTEILAIDKTADYYTFTLYSVDKLGNISEGITSRCYISNVLKVTSNDAIEKIGELTQSCTVELTGEITNPTLRKIIKAINNLSDEIYINFDISNTTGITYLSGGEEPTNGEFYNCSNLKSIILPDTLTTLGDAVFYGCKNLSSVTIPDKVTKIGKWTFQYCESLVEIKLPNSLMSIGQQAFCGCSTLAYIQIPDTVETIGQSAFSECIKLLKADLGKNVSEIGRFVFDGCSNLREITIFNSVSSIGDYIVNNCKNLTAVYFIGTLENWLGMNFNSHTNPCLNGTDLFINGEKLVNLIIPNNITSVKNYAFFGCGSLESVEIPSHVTMGASVFSNCSALKTVTIENGVKSIGTSDFYNCQNLTEIVIPNSIEVIGSHAFFSTNLTKAVFANTIGWKAGDIEIPSSDIENTSKAANYLKFIDYGTQKWTKTD